MHNKCITIAVVIAVVVGGGAFYGGMKYAQGQAASQVATRGGGQGGFGAGAGGAGRAAGAGGQRGANGGGGFSGGQITAQDATSITIKTRTGSSQIVFYSPSTSIEKSVSGAASDLSVGEQVTTTGTTNPDGSLAATSIQIRPADATGGPSGAPATPGN